MIETLKRWMGNAKSSTVVKPFLAVKNWFQENVIKRKFICGLDQSFGWSTLFSRTPNLHR